MDENNFRDEHGNIRTGFFHRFNVPAMEQEILRAFGEIEFEEDQSLIVECGDGLFDDINYWRVFPNSDPETIVQRRRIASEFVRNLTTSKIIVLTLGLAEAWFHKPSGLFANGVPGDVLVRRRKEFDMKLVTFQENMASLEAILRCVKKHHETGEFHMVVTVSPVPMGLTFTRDDIVVANQRAKSTLRAVAGEFCASNNEFASYFPSYEIAMYSPPEFVWRPDRIHVNPTCVEHIVGQFRHNYETVQAP